MHELLGAAALAVAGVLTAGHGATGAPRRAPAAVAAEPGVKLAAQRELAAWRDYPVGVTPRAIVLVGGAGERVLQPQPRRAAGQRRIDTGVYELPTGLSTRSGVRHGYRLISERAAARRLPIATPATPPRTPRLRVVGVTLATGRFSTDRPGVAYPAWRFHISGFRQPTRVLAAPAWPAPIERQATLPPDVLINQFGESATVDDGGRSLRLSFIGAPAGLRPCDADYTARAYTSPTAVVPVILTEAPRSTTGHGVWCADGGVERHVTVDLSRPLGARVVVNIVNRDAIPVTGGGG